MRFLRLTGAALLLLAFLACGEGPWLSEQEPFESGVILNPAPQAAPTSPLASLASVSVGGGSVCEIRIDGSLYCRPENEAKPLPSGPFRSVSVGGQGACGVRDDGSVACWRTFYGEWATLPEGSFASVSVGHNHACGIRGDGSVACWGNNGEGQPVTPEGRFASLSIGLFYSCGVREDGSIVCWGYDEHLPAPPSDGPVEAVSVSAYSGHSCGVRDDGSVACWGSTGGELAVPPEGPFSSVTVGHNIALETVACGLRENKTIACWQLQDRESLDCGVFEDGSIASCQGLVENLNIRAGEDETIYYSGDDEHLDEYMDQYHACGVDEDGFLVCRDDDENLLPSPPEGPFKSVSVVPDSGHG